MNWCVRFGMFKNRYLFAFLLTPFSAPLSTATDLHKYVAKSSCNAGLERGSGSNGIRLDKSQIARLEAQTSNGNKLLMIVQYAKQYDECGVVRDIVQARNNKVDFVFECVNTKSLPASLSGLGQTVSSGPRVPRLRRRRLN